MRKWSKFIFAALFTVSMIAFQSSYYFLATTPDAQETEQVQKYNDVKEKNEMRLPEPIATPSNEVIRIGDKMQVRISGLDISAGDGNYVSHISYEWFTEKWMPNRILESIEVPRVTATGIDGNEYNVEVFHMTISGGSYWVSDPFRLTDDQPTHIITRDDMLPFVNEQNNGEWPATMYLLFDGVPKSVTGKPEPSFTPKDLDYIFHGDIVLNYTITEEPPYSEDTYDYFSGVYDYVIKKQNGDEMVASDSVKQTAYLWYETSDVSITSDKSIDLVPGEEVLLTFTIHNPSKIKNNLTLDIDVQGLTIITEKLDSEIDLSSWVNSEGGYSLPIVDMNKDWINLDEDSTIQFTQKFKINDNFLGEKIVISPSLTAINKNDFEFNNDFILMMKEKNTEESNPEPDPDPTPGKPTQPEETIKNPENSLSRDSTKLVTTGERINEKILYAGTLLIVSFVLSILVRRR